MSDLTIQVCSFNTPSKSAHKYIDKQSVKAVLASEKFKENLKKGRLLGLFTHKDRYTVDDKNIPFEDNIATSKFLCNCCRNMWIDEQRNALMGDFDLLNNEYGNLLRDMYKKGIMMPVSMSVSAHADNSKYYIDDILGVDMTQRPDLEAEVVSVSFSEKSSDNEHMKVCFSQILDESNCSVNYSDEEDNLNKVNNTDEDNHVIDVENDNIIAPKKFETVEVTRVGGIKEDEDFEDVVVKSTPSKEPEGLVNKIEKLNNTLDITNEKLSGKSLTKELKNNADVDDSIGNVNIPISRAKPVNNEVVGSETVVTNLNTDNDKVVENQTNLDCGSVAGNEVSNIDPIVNEDNFSEDELDNKDYEEIHKDIDVADQMTEDQLKQLPNKITSTVETVFSELNKYKQLNCSTLDINKLKESAMRKNGTIPTEFSITSYVAEFNLQPWQVLRRRINEVIQICRAKKQDWINTNYERLRTYFDSYILTWVQNILNNPSTEFNIILGLRLANYQVDNKKMREFNRTIKRMRTQLNNVGYMDKQLQNKLNTQFQAIENDIYTFINNKVGESGKKFVPQGNIEPTKIT